MEPFPTNPHRERSNAQLFCHMTPMLRYTHPFMEGINIHTSTSRPIQTSTQPDREVNVSIDKQHTKRYSDSVLDYASKHMQISSLVDIGKRIDAKKKQ